MNCCECGVNIDCSGSGCGAPNGVSCISTENSNPSLGVAQSSGRDYSSLINNLSILGITIASAATGRPVVNQNGVKTLGSKPLITGQVQASTVLLVFGAAVVAFLVYKAAD